LDIFDVIQLLGGTILSIGYIPQIRQMIKTKAVKDLNSSTFLMTLIGVGLMECYAINLFINHGAGVTLLITNSINFFMNAIINFLIFYYRRKQFIL